MGTCFPKGVREASADCPARQCLTLHEMFNIYHPNQKLWFYTKPCHCECAKIAEPWTPSHEFQEVSIHESLYARAVNCLHVNKPFLATQTQSQHKDNTTKSQNEISQVAVTTVHRHYAETTLKISLKQKSRNSRTKQRSNPSHILHNMPFLSILHTNYTSIPASFLHLNLTINKKQLQLQQHFTNWNAQNI